MSVNPHGPKGERGTHDKIGTSASILRTLGSYSDSTLLEMAKSKAYKPETLGDDTRFVPVEISNNNLDSWFTRMTEKTLNNFARRAGGGGDGKGVGVQNSHNTDELPWGRSLTGDIIVEPGKGWDGGDLVRVVSVFYAVPNYQPGRVNSDVLLRGIDTGTTTDISVGFYGGEFRCGLCGGDLFAGWFGMWPLECDHIPGVYNDVKDPESGEVVDRVLGWAWIDDADLSEYSTVYDGATPGASVLKARAMADAGALSPERVREVESQLERQLAQFGIRLKGGSHRYPGWRREDAGLIVLGGEDMPRGRVKVTRDNDEETTVDLEVADELDPQDDGGDELDVADDGEREVEDDGPTGTPTEDTESDEDDDSAEDDEADEEGDADEGRSQRTSRSGTSIDLGDDEDDEDVEERAATPTRSAPNDLAARLSRVRARYKDEGIAIGDDPVEAVDVLARTLVEIKNTKLKERTILRRTFADIILREGARAEGKKFKRAMVKRFLKNADVADMVTTYNEYRTDAAARFKGGRITRDGMDFGGNGHDDSLEVDENVAVYQAP